MEDIKQTILNKISALQDKKEHLLIAIDGKCGSGKTTLALSLKKYIDCNIIHMDHFFLRPEQRTEKRINEPGGNVDYERFYSDVIIPLSEKRSFTYESYDCKSGMSFPIDVEFRKINIIEGAYSCHNLFSDFYDLKIFLDIDAEKQKERIIKRNGKAAYKMFEDTWIPMEEVYFKTHNIKDKCDLCFCEFNCNMTCFDV